MKRYLSNLAIIGVCLAAAGLSFCKGSSVGSSVYVPAPVVGVDVLATGQVQGITGDGGAQLAVTPGNIQWPASASVNLTQTAPSSDAITKTQTWTAQPPYASASTNINPGGLTAQLGTQSTGAQTSKSYFHIAGDSTNLFSFGGDPNNDTAAMFWMEVPAGSETAANYTMFSYAGALIINQSGGVSIDYNGNPVLTTGSYSLGIKLQAPDAFYNATWSTIVGTLDLQNGIVNHAVGVVKTSSSATPTAILTYTPPPGATTNGGLLTCRLVTRATTTGTGVAIGDTAIATYALGYKDVSGTVTLSTAGITLVGVVQTTAAAVTSVLTAAASTSTIVISVTNTSLATFDSQVDCTVDIN